MPLYLMSICLVVLFFSTSAIAQSRFVGSEECMSCHKAIYETWRESKHSKAIQILSPDNDTVISDWEGTVKLKAGKIPEVTIKLSRGPGGTYQATLVDAKDSYNEMTYTVVRTQGGGWTRGQRYQIKIGNNYFHLPIDWNPASSTWDPFALDWWYNDDGSLKQPPLNRSWAMTCAGCHHTGIELKKVNDGFEITYSELNTGCEKCHGPGSGHVESSGEKGEIINPSNLPYEREVDVCTQCHSMAASVPNGYLSYPWNDEDNEPYMIGEPLTDYYRPGGDWVPPGSSDSISLRTEHSLSKSKHYEAQVTCSDCHNPHGGPAQSQLIRADFDNDLCLYCHGKDEGFASPASIREHTKHSYAPRMKGTSRCMSCHSTNRRQMPISGTPPSPGATSSGFLGVIKPQTSLEMFKSNPKSVFINSCNRCHTDWSGDEAGYKKGVEGYEAKFGKKQ